MLKDRVLSGVLIGVAFLAAVFWMPLPGALLILLAICAMALLEFYALLDSAQIPHFKYLGLLSGLLLVGATWLSLRSASGSLCDVEWMVLFAIAVAIFLRQFPQKNNPHPLETVAGTLLGVIYVSFLFNFFTKLLLSWGDRSGRLLLLYLIVVVKASDMGAYFVGCTIGRHKLIPRISPAKTWEGTFGGLASALVVSLLFSAFARGHIGVLNLHLSDAAILGVVLAATGAVGDLTESLFKRGAGVKDSGRMILGMGGILDVIDSLLFAAPALYVYARFFL